MQAAQMHSDAQYLVFSKRFDLTSATTHTVRPQTLNCLELWMKVLSAAAVKGSALQPLVYPLTQLLLGAARLVPTPRYFPIRLRLVRAVNKLAQVW